MLPNDDSDLGFLIWRLELKGKKSRSWSIEKGRDLTPMATSKTTDEGGSGWRSAVAAAFGRRCLRIIIQMF
jgi:hypothetical protein